MGTHALRTTPSEPTDKDNMAPHAGTASDSISRPFDFPFDLRPSTYLCPLPSALCP